MSGVRFGVFLAAVVALAVSCLASPQRLPTTNPFDVRGFEAHSEASAAGDFLLGAGVFDITGPAAEEGMMGYAMLEQKTSGLHMRLRSRAFIFADPADTSQRVVFVSVDLAMVFDEVRAEVLSILQRSFGPKLYTLDNVLISATHTHGGPGGFAYHLLYDLTTLGFSREHFTTITQGIAQSIKRAHARLSPRPGRVLLAQGELHDSNANRSPTSYLENPEAERAQYEHNTDHNMVLLRLQDDAGRDLGAINWFAVHGTSMSNENSLISGDNKGYASYLFERHVNGPHVPTGSGAFVAAFAQTNEGDVSPNTTPATCRDGTPCDLLHSTCGGRTQECKAKGPGANEFESTRIIGERQFRHALALFARASEPVRGPIRSVHQYVDFSDVRVAAAFTGTGEAGRTCSAALGDSFAAGTTDGPGEFNFRQGTNSTKTNALWNLLSHTLLHKPTDTQKACQAPKPILLDVGKLDFPCQWAPNVLPIQTLRIGSLFIAGVPGEFTTMSGRRLRNSMRQAIVDAGGPADAVVVVAGLANHYSHYITTHQEYRAQRYEAASTLYGPHTLAAHQQLFSQQAAFLAAAPGAQPAPPAGPSPPDLKGKQVNLQPGVVLDTAPFFKRFGSVAKDAQKAYRQGDVVLVQFWGAHPKNNFKTEDTYLTVERRDELGRWTAVYNDGDWCTRYLWRRSGISNSKITVRWEIPADQQPGQYRITHSGHHRNILQSVKPYSGNSRTFTVDKAFKAL